MKNTIVLLKKYNFFVIRTFKVMPLVDLLCEKWRRMRAERARGEESRLQIFESLNAAEKDRACQEIASWLKEADNSSDQNDGYYYSQAEQKIAGFRWQLYRLNQPFIWLEKKIIEPLNFWSNRANIFQFLSKVSPVIEAVGVLAIPILIFNFENYRTNRESLFEEQREKQQAVGNYLSRINTIYLELKVGNPEKSVKKQIEEDIELQTFLEATTLAIFEELSISEDSLIKSSESGKSDSKFIAFDPKIIERDYKGQVVDFLINLSWIQLGDTNETRPLLSLRNSNLSKADLAGTSLRRADLSGAKLIGADLAGAYLTEADLSGAHLEVANLVEADLELANLTGAYLNGVNLTEAELYRAELGGADLTGAYLNKAELSETNFSRANLTRANLTRANLTRANLDFADLQSVTFCRTTMPNGKINNRDCPNN